MELFALHHYRYNGPAKNDLYWLENTPYRPTYPNQPNGTKVDRTCVPEVNPSILGMGMGAEGMGACVMKSSGGGTENQTAHAQNSAAPHGEADWNQSRDQQGAAQYSSHYQTTQTCECTKGDL